MSATHGEANYILLQGPDWVALNKPSGMSTHNDVSGSGGGSSGSFTEDALSYVTRVLNAKPGSVSPVHRLDRETSGILLFATTREAASRLQQAWGVNSGSKKFYRAVVRGKLTGTGLWDFPISDKSEGRENPAGRASDRKEALTKFEVVRATDFLSDLRIELLTGRQHQIRKHSRLAKHGLVGDTRYGEASHARKMESLYGVSRLMLHAEKLNLLEIELEAPLPPEFEKFFGDKP
ncbi:MAG: RNA pseudouridine synthase [Proteobacteria bacterium]|nr:MAG: RNA pseudouridine synthase [Pseudomonadota bacterium]